ASGVPAVPAESRLWTPADREPDQPEHGGVSAADALGPTGLSGNPGDLLVIPIEEALMYVQPIYLRAEGGRIPELKRVVVAYQNRVVMRETLEEGLAEMFGGEVASH